MKSVIRLSLIIMVSAALLTSCKKSVPKQTRHIPKSAVFVAAINTKSIETKLVKNQATIENILKSASGSDTSVSEGKQEWEDIKNSGIDLDENFYMSVVQKGGGMSAGKGSMVISAIGSLQDEAKLKAYIQKKQPKSEIRKEKNYSYTTIHGDNMVAWNEDLVIMMSYQKSMQGEMEFDSTTGSYNFKNPVNSDATLKTEMDSYFNLKEDESVAAIPEFRDLMQDKGDASMWINSSASLDDMSLPLPKLKELFSNTFTTATLNFDDGKIAINTKSYYSSQMKDLLKKYAGPEADLGLVEHYPSNNINSLAVVAFNPEFFNALVRYLEVGGVVDGYLTKMMGSNYTLQDALKAIKGDLALVVSDFAMPAADPAAGVAGLIPKFKMILNIPVGDKVQMNKLMDKVVEMQMLVKVNNEYRLAPAMQKMGWQVLVNDKNLLIASDEALLTQYRAQSAKAGLSKDAMDDFKGKQGVVYINLESILNGIPAQSNAEINNILPKAKETFKDMRFYSDKYNGNYAEGFFELRFKNEKDNSLSSLLGFIETVSKNMPKNQGVKMNDMMPDSTEITAPPEPVK